MIQFFPRNSLRLKNAPRPVPREILVQVLIASGPGVQLNLIRTLLGVVNWSIAWKLIASGEGGRRRTARKHSCLLTNLSKSHARGRLWQLTNLH